MATAPLHDRVDAAFGRFQLSRRDRYAAFLGAHARALLPIEAAVSAEAVLPGWSARGPLLITDLADFGEAPPPPVTMNLPTSIAARWGMLYVIEGSRLGGAMLARAVGEGLPKRYLDAGHRDGSWQRFGLALEAAAGDDAWRAAALAGATRAFAAFEQAAAAEPDRIDGN